MNLDESVAAIVTGGGSGLGAAVARMLAEAGVRVAILDRSSDGDAVAAGFGGLFVQVDVTSDDDVVQAFASARAAHGQERILVNCAGIAPAARTTSRAGPHPIDLFRRVVEVNLIGCFHCLALSASGMTVLEPLEGGMRGVVINTASIAAFDGQMGQAAYAASKAGVAGLTLPVARDLSTVGIRVCTIAPGVFETPLMAGLSDEVRESLGRQVPFPPRLGNPADFAGLVRHACENDYLNGEVIRLDGAMRMGMR